MSRPILTRILLVLWAAAVAMSLWYLFMVEATGDGFTRGLNRLTGFLGWQLVAAILAGSIWWTGRGLARGRPLRWASRVPGLLVLALVVLIAGMILWARLADPPPPYVPPGPVTAPAEDARPVD